MTDTKHNSTLDVKAEILALIDTCTAIFKAKDKAAIIKMGNNHLIMLCLKKYTKIMDETEGHEHLEYFESVFKKYASQILKGYDNDDWLRQNKVIIQYGEGITNPSILRKIKDYRIMLSDVYNFAVTMKELADKRCEEDPTAQVGDELIYPEQMMLHLYRIFNECVKDKDQKTKLEAQIKELESIFTEPTVETKQNGTNGLMGMLGQLMGKLGGGQELKMPSENDVKNVMDTVLNNKDIPNIFTNLMSSFQSSDGLGSIINKVGGIISDPQLMKSLAPIANMKELKSEDINKAISTLSSSLSSGNSISQSSSQSSSSQSSSSSTSQSSQSSQSTTVAVSTTTPTSTANETTTVVQPSLSEGNSGSQPEVKS